MNKEEESGSWFVRLKQFLQGEPQNQEELVSLLRDAQIRSLINSETLAMIEGSISFSKMRVRDIMLPKNQMVCLNQDDSYNDIIKVVTQTGHSRFPVTGENSDEIIGILHAKDLLRRQAEGEESFDLLDSCRQVTIVPESKRLDSLLSEFRCNRNHMAIVVDEYGSTVGIVTMDDVVDALVGDATENDQDEYQIIKRNETSWLVDGQYSIIEFIKYFDLNLEEEDLQDKFTTVAGLIIHKNNTLPNIGDSIIVDNYKLEIIDKDGQRIDKILVTKLN